MKIKNILTYLGENVIIDLSDNTKLQGILHQSIIKDYFYCINDYSMCRNVVVNKRDIKNITRR